MISNELVTGVQTWLPQAPVQYTCLITLIYLCYSLAAIDDDSFSLGLDFSRDSATVIHKTLKLTEQRGQFGFQCLLHTCILKRCCLEVFFTRSKVFRETAWSKILWASCKEWRSSSLPSARGRVFTQVGHSERLQQHRETIPLLKFDRAHNIAGIASAFSFFLFKLY